MNRPNRSKHTAEDYEDQLRGLAAEGKTCTGAAAAIGVHYKATKRMAGELGITFKKGGRGSETPMTRWKQRIDQLSARELAMDPVARWA